MSTDEQDRFSWQRHWRAGLLWTALLLAGVAVLYVASGTSSAPDPTAQPTEELAGAAATPTVAEPEPTATPTTTPIRTPTATPPAFPEPPKAQLTYEGETFVAGAIDYCWPISPTHGEICAESDRGPAEQPGFQVSPGSVITFNLDTDDAYTMGASVARLVPHPQNPEWGLDWERPSIPLPVELSPDGWQIAADAPDGEYELGVGIEMEVFTGHFGRAGYFFNIIIGDPNLVVSFPGTITAVERGDGWVSMEVTNFPDDVTPGEVFIVGITTDTVIQHSLGEPGTMDDLKRGAEIRATIVGEIAASDPPRGHAERLVITQRVVESPVLLNHEGQSQSGVLDGRCHWYENQPFCYPQGWMNLPETTVTVKEWALLAFEVGEVPFGNLMFVEPAAYLLDGANLGTVRGMPVLYLEPHPPVQPLYPTGTLNVNIPANLPQGEWAILLRLQTTQASPSYIFRIRIEGEQEPNVEGGTTGTLMSIDRQAWGTTLLIVEHPDAPASGAQTHITLYPNAHIFESTAEGAIRRSLDDLETGMRVSLVPGEVTGSSGYPASSELVIVGRSQ